MYSILALICFAVFVSLALFPLAKRTGAPLLLVILAVGMLIGEDGVGGYLFNDFQLAFDVGSVALAVILFAGGLETDKGVFRSSGAPALILAFPGVLVTATIVAGAAYFFLDMPLMLALLLGAVIAPTDAAATFMFIQQSELKIPSRLKNTLLLESGFNDPAAISLTIILTVIIGVTPQVAADDWLTYIWLVAAQIGFGVIGGLVGGWLLAEVMNRLTMSIGIYPVLAVIGGVLVFAVTYLLGGSGFLAIYIAGMTLRNRLHIPLERITNFSEGMQWLSQMILFLILGLLVTPSDLPGAIFPALICAAVLTFVARPIAVFASVGWFQFKFKELVFLSWVGLRGAVPILLAIYPVVAPGPVDILFFETVFIIVVVSLTLQGSTAGAIGKVLKLDRE